MAFIIITNGAKQSHSKNQNFHLPQVVRGTIPDEPKEACQTWLRKLWCQQDQVLGVPYSGVDGEQPQLLNRWNQSQAVGQEDQQRALSWVYLQTRQGWLTIVRQVPSAWVFAKHIRSKQICHFYKETHILEVARDPWCSLKDIQWQKFVSCAWVSGNKETKRAFLPFWVWEFDKCSQGGFIFLTIEWGY